jgi:CubicO group peptidase (beta-lactamase class C family)
MWETGLGYGDVEHAVRARPDTPYHISGLTEVLSSALLLEGCYENGHLSLDDRIQQRSTQAPDATITIRTR